MGSQDGVQYPHPADLTGDLEARVRVLESLLSAGAVPTFEQLANAGGKSAPLNGQAWIYHAATKRWIPESVAGAPNLAFGQAGSLTASTSPALPMPVAGIIDGGSFNVTTAGSTDTVVTVYKNGSSAFTVTLPAGSTAVETVTGVGLAVIQYDLITAAVTTVGTGAKDLGGFVHTI